VAIGPLDLHDLGPVRSFDARGLELGIIHHARLPLLAPLLVYGRG
jgi:hypothetical protein